MTSHVDLDAVIEAAARAEFEATVTAATGLAWENEHPIDQRAWRTDVTRAATAAAAETERQLRERWCRSGDYADGGAPC